MIREIRLKNFKCFGDQTFAVGGMTLLTGLNGMGKSSLLQALLLLRQSHQMGFLKERGLALNGELACLGNARDVLFLEAREDEIAFDLMLENGTKAAWSFACSGESAILPLLAGPGSGDIFREGLFGQSFHYLQAERTGPRTSFQVSPEQTLGNRGLGKAGEYCAHVLATLERESIPIQALGHPDAVSIGLRDQVEAWIASVSPGTRIHAVPYPDMDLVSLQFSFVGEGFVSDHYRATNVGFALTYALPLIVATLMSAPGALLLIENPEAHLHPRAQIKLTELFARAAAHGVQVVLETHSDHVLNGLRLAVHGGHIPPEKACVHFFRRAKGGMQTEVVSPDIDRRGRIDHWPEDFFDEWEKSLDSLLD